MADTQNGTVKDAVSTKASNAYSYAQRSLDRVVPPSSRQQAWDTGSAYASARPILFSFGVAQLLFSFLPLLAFITFAISTIVFALGVAVVFSLFWIGVALLALVPALLVTSCIGVLAWAWAVGSFVVARWIYTRLPVGVQSDTQVKVGSKQLNVVKDQNGINAKVEHN